MEILADPLALQRRTLKWRDNGLTIAFVPTMGFLHEGHLSLMRAARERADKVIVSIFVNPTQFGPTEDFEAYPRDDARDTRLTEEAGADLLFRPPVAAMYPANAATWVEVPDLARYLCGASRPTHFRGVCTVVCKLLHLTMPHSAFFGEKDWQQLAIIRRMAEDLMFPLEIVGCPIVREEDGLAKSSRNVNLTPQERAQAVWINRSLDLIAQTAKGGERNIARLLDAAKNLLSDNAPSGAIDYYEAVDPDKITPVSSMGSRVLFAAAVKFSKVRLIDNRLISL